MRMAYKIENKVVLITGAATGIGALIVQYLLRDGAEYVAVLDVNEDAGISLENELNTMYNAPKVKFIKCDVSNEEELSSAFNTVLKEKGYIDVVINNAGIMNDSKRLYKKSIEVNYSALVTSTLKAIEVMRKDLGGKGGTVINISSVAALCQNPLTPIYYGTKSAVLQFSNCIGLPVYYFTTGVRVLTICFGATNTPLLTNIGYVDETIEDKVAEILKPFRRQRPESAAQGVIDAFKTGESGSTWLSTHDEPAKDITETVKTAYKMLSDLVFY